MRAFGTLFYGWARREMVEPHHQSPSVAIVRSVRPLAWVGTAIMLTAGCIASSMAFASYVFTELPALSGGYRAFPAAINNAGQVIGFTDFSSACSGCGSSSRATLWTNTATPVQLTSYGTGTYAVDINDDGVVVGYQYFSDGPTQYGVKWVNGEYIPLPYLGKYSEAAGINNSGQIVGTDGSSPIIWSPSGTATYLDGSAYITGINDSGQLSGTFGNDPARWTGMTPTLLGTLGGDFARTHAINNHGQVIGYSLTSGGYYHATLWNDVEAIDLGSFGSHSYALGINSDGDVVGQANYASGGLGAFLWSSDGLVDLNDLLDQKTTDAGWTLYFATDINDVGQIIGTARNTLTQQTQGFLLTPMDVPEPATYWLILAALVLMPLTRRNRLTVEV